ncbi:MAG: YciI family protein [Bryobacteraceae bacterium]|nr:YciI family protein [Bryobacteraceae bacterium]
MFGAGVLRQQAAIVATDGSSSPGPLPGTKAVVGGFSIIEVPTRDEALAWAARIAKSCRCAQEVRELMYDPES